MFDWPEKALTWLLTLLGGLLAMILGIGRYFVHKNDGRHDSHSAKYTKLGERITNLELQSVSKATLGEVEREWREELRRSGEETNRKLDKIDISVSSIHRRIDAMFGAKP